jgi:hypothetical protein
VAVTADSAVEKREIVLFNGRMRTRKAAYVAGAIVSKRID